MNFCICIVQQVSLTIYQQVFKQSHPINFRPHIDTIICVSDKIIMCAVITVGINQAQTQFLGLPEKTKILKNPRFSLAKLQRFLGLGFSWRYNAANMLSCCLANYQEAKAVVGWTWAGSADQTIFSVPGYSLYKPI